MAIRTTGTFEPVGAFPVVDSANVSNVCTDSEAAAIRAGATRAYPTCASVRADTSASANNPHIYVLDRGAFSWTTDAGTDTGNELTDYIAGTGGGFAFQSILYQDYADTVTDPAHHPGRVFYDNSSLSVMTEFAGVILQLGEENQVQVYNGESVQINNGQVVYAYGPQGQRLDVRKLASGSGNSIKLVGLLTHDAATHTNCRATTFGLVRGLNTGSYSGGAELYTSTTAGNLSATKPTGDQDGSRIGFVVSSHPTDGTIFVSPVPISRLAYTTATLPSTLTRIGESYLDSTLNRPVWRNVANSAWIPASNGMSVPSAYVAKASPSGTTSATLEDVPGATTTITITTPQYVVINASFEVQTQSGGSASTIGVAIVYDSVTGPEYQRYMSGSGDLGLGAITTRTTLLSAGTYTIKLQYRRVSGVSTPGIDKAELTAIGTALQ